MREHDKIINQAAKKVLAPQGLFRKGSSRVWLDDNGYFIIQVEFQPSNWSKGSYLNVGICFLWESSQELNETMAFNYGYRVSMDGKQFADYTGDDGQFMGEMEEFAEMALQKVLEYRQFRDMEYAERQMARQLSGIPKKRQFWEPYHLAMLCFLKGDFEVGKKFFHYFMQILKDSFYTGDVYIEWHEVFYNYCVEHIQPCLVSGEAAQKMVSEMIRRRREFFGSKPSYKKMNQKEWNDLPIV